MKSYDQPVITDVLISDVQASHERLQQSDTPQNRRDYVRTAFAGVEGLVWFLKETTFDPPIIYTVSVSPYELDALFERSYHVTNSGNVKQTSKFISLTTSFKLLARIIKRSAPTFSPQSDAERWENLKTAAFIRNRITHPKHSKDLEVSESDVELISNVFYFTLAFVLRAIAALKRAKGE